MRDLNVEEIGHVYGAGGKSCYNACKPGKGGSRSKGKGTGSKGKKHGTKGKRSGSKGRCR